MISIKSGRAWTRTRRGTVEASRITLLEELRDGVVVLTLNRPKRRNAFNDQQYDDLRSALAEARANDEVRVAVITGTAATGPGRRFGFVA